MATVVASQGVHLATPEDSLLSTSSQSTTPPNNLYCLDIRQQPRQARLASSGEKTERRTVDPPPIIQLRLRRPSARRKPSHTLTDDDFVSPTVTHRHFMFASLVPENSEEELYEVAGRNKLVAGNIVSSLFHLRGQTCFVFPDLSVRTEGRWRFKMSMYEIVEDGVVFCDSVVTDVFQVYSGKRFAGMSKSTELSKSFAQQGLKLRIRKAGARDNEEANDKESAPPARKKSKPTPRSRPSLSVATWPTSSRSQQTTPVVNRRSSGPPDLSHDIALITPAGSTSVPQQKRPWTSWNASPPSKIAPPFPSNGNSYHESYSNTARAGVIRSYSQDLRRLPPLDERNTAPTSYTRPHSSHYHPSQQMPPPPPRHSPPTSSTPGSFPTPPESSSRFSRYPSPPTVLAPIRSNLPQPVNRTPSLEWSDPFRRSESSKSSAETVEPDEGVRRNEEATQVKKRSKGSGGSLAMLLGEGGADPKAPAEISFF